MQICPFCGKECKQLTKQHLDKHGITINDFKQKYPNISLSNEGALAKIAKLKNERCIQDNIKCLFCKTLITSAERKSQKFCSHSCSSKYYNQIRGLKAIEKSAGFCKTCNAPVINKQYCTHKCRLTFEYNTYIEKWKKNEISGIAGKFETSNYIRKFLIEKYENKCSNCGWHEVNKYTHKVPIQLHHIDGNFRNNREENLVLLCPNCHSLTPTFGGLNKGNGRTERYK